MHRQTRQNIERQTRDRQTDKRKTTNRNDWFKGTHGRDKSRKKARTHDGRASEREGERAAWIDV